MHFQEAMIYVYGVLGAAKVLGQRVVFEYDEVRFIGHTNGLLEIVLPYTKKEVLRRINRFKTGEYDGRLFWIVVNRQKNGCWRI